MEKRELRKKYKKLRQDFNGEDRKRAEEQVTSNTLKLPLFKRAKSVMFFVSFQSEIDTILLIKEALALKKRVFVPYCQPDSNIMYACEIHGLDELSVGEHGILEPQFSEKDKKNSKILDVIFVPALVFDEIGYRLGYGCGYYDKFLEQVPKNTTTIGLGFAFQVVERLPIEAHDKKLSMLVTENTIMDF